MLNIPIRNLQSSKQIPSRVFDAVLDGDKSNPQVSLKIKPIKQTESISWEDVKYQVERAIQEYTK